MATQCKKIDTLVVPLETKPGSLSRVYNAFQEAKINVLASWAYEMGPDKAEAVLYVSDTGKAKDVLTKLGKQPRLSNACYAIGDDKIGNYAELLQKIARANVNLRSTDAHAINGKFATVFFCEDRDVQALCKALGC